MMAHLSIAMKNFQTFEVVFLGFSEGHSERFVAASVNEIEK